ncbi:hypothetical protein R2R35_18545 [Anaerocolumna sp. AGMB13020]|uniref:hypothetical protein n=1 Tax=Anaerocolumna sp. AGMB13020 TaxID=3081750 RepID=UPI00295353B7|nr:hypothetical protein [Anaerocolumna sp. AGMB13020]WOO35781.1 hypothetical protein R2R35_18545 [Anaerocolumna sp. AGMB13020]
MQIKGFVSIAFLLFFILMIINCKQVKADTNMDGGGSGGGSQSGTSENFYSSGDDGVRITIIDIKTGMRATGTWSIDYFRKSKEDKTITHFGKVNKLEYMGVSGYSSAKALQQSAESYRVDGSGKTVAYRVEDMPIIVSSSLGNSDIEKIKDYFDDKARLEVIASRVGISYSEMINGNYKMIIEPVIYLTFQGRYIAMTAHEAAKLDMALGGTSTTGGQLRAKFVSFSHKNLPLSIFLKKKELGVKRWTGSKKDRVNNGQILEYLGIGILSFEPEGTEVDVGGGNYQYRPNTDVITSVDVSVENIGYGATSDNPITVQFSGDLIPTTTVTGIVIPAGGSRPVWFKWRTPYVKELKNSKIYVNITEGSSTTSSAVIDITVKPIVEKEPANPTADDKRKSTWSDDTLPAFPKILELKNFSVPNKSTSWHTYTCTKRSVWTGDYETDWEGNYILDAWGSKIPIYTTVYDFTTNNYSASLISTTASIKPDSKTKVTNTNDYYIKSGYGIELKVNSSISGNSDVTGIQNAVVYFPEFKYGTYRRIGKLPGAGLNGVIEFPVNMYSLHKSRVHFLPIWFPDKEYKVYIETLDAWTPGGMLCDYTTASINVKGSMWDDFHISVLPNY